MNLSSIGQYLQNIDYSWTKPKTYLVIVPGISLIIQKIQLANILPLISEILEKHPTMQQSSIQVDGVSRKFANICKWHLRGSMIQIMVCLIAMKIFAAPMFLSLGILAGYEMVDTLIKSLRNTVIFYEFYPNGNVKNITYSNAYNIF